MALTYEEYYRRYLDDPTTQQSGTPPISEIVVGPPGPPGIQGPPGPQGPPMNVADENVVLPGRPTLNFIGTGVTATDDPVNDAIDVNITAGVGQNQSPWLSDINANNHSLSAVNTIQGNTAIITNNINTIAGQYLINGIPLAASNVGAVPTTRSVNTGTGLQGGGPLSSDLNLSVIPNTTTQLVTVTGGGGTSVRPALNFVASGGLSFTILDDNTNNRANVILQMGQNVTSFNGRSGGVLPATGDYNITQITNGVSTSRLINTGTGLTGGGDLSADRTLSIVPQSVNQLTNVYVNNALIALRPGINLVAGTNITLTGATNTGLNTVDVLISAAGGTAPVSSVFTRTGAVVAQTGDYTAAQITNAADTSTTYADPSWITSLAWTKITGRPTALVNTISPGALTGNVILSGGTGISVNSAGQTITIAASPAALQTPWVSNINGSTFNLNNVGTIAVGLAAVTSPALVHIRAGNSGITPTTSTRLFVENSGAAAYIETACANLTDSCGYIFSSAGSLTSYIVDISTTLQMVTTGARPIKLTTGSGAHNVTMLPNGNVGLDVANPVHQLQLSTDDAAKLTTTTWSTTSGKAVKQNVKDLKGGLNIINKIRPIEGEHNGKHGTHKGQRIVSVIAEEVQKVLPHTVYSKDDVLYFNPHEIIFQLILAVQDLSKQVEELKHARNPVS